jgi:hypothetical protein
VLACKGRAVAVVSNLLTRTLLFLSKAIRVSTPWRTPNVACVIIKDCTGRMRRAPGLKEGGRDALHRVAPANQSLPRMLRCPLGAPAVQGESDYQIRPSSAAVLTAGPDQPGAQWAETSGAKHLPCVGI